MNSTIYDSKWYALSLREDRLLVKKILQLLNPQPEDTILEVGCSRGFLTRRIQHYSKNTLGIDINSEAISRGVTKNLVCMDTTKLGFPTNTFDKIYSCHAIEHIPDLEKALGEMARVLKTKGKLVLVYPAEPIRGIFAIRASILMFKNPFLGREIHVHKLSPKTIRKLAQTHHMRHVESHFSLLMSPQYSTVLQKRANNNS